MTASSYYSSYWLPHYGRLNDTRGGGWAARLSSSVSDWLQIDFERTVQVCAVETQGDVDGNEWVIAFYLSFSSDGVSWSNSTYENGTQVIFTRQGDHNYIDQETLPVTVFARYIRFHPIFQHAWNTLRVEVYEGNPTLPPSSTPLESSTTQGPSTTLPSRNASSSPSSTPLESSTTQRPSTTPASTCFHHAVGVADPSIISDDQMTASSYYSSYWLPHYGRLNDTRGGGWAARLSSSVSDWLQIDFERTVQVCAVETQGDVDGNEWVIAFYLSFSSDGVSWSNSTYENGTQVIFTRQGDHNYIDQETLPVTVFARYIRFHPISQHAWNTLRVEVYEACFHHAVGVADPSIISDDQMTASSYYSSYWLPHYGRLNDTRGGGWAARLSSSVSDWLQIDFERTVQVCAVETQGDVDGNEWVIAFYLSFSSDGVSWSNSTYENGNAS
ncbi:lactadherin-like, partial [Montipora foliosa]|uniref:lactadherin-like n=1 Tax=Montipora foliosa TaxID=591990 RepID=UPI0035F20197